MGIYGSIVTIYMRLAQLTHLIMFTSYSPLPEQSSGVAVSQAFLSPSPAKQYLQRRKNRSQMTPDENTVSILPEIFLLLDAGKCSHLGGDPLGFKRRYVQDITYQLRLLRALLQPSSHLG
ncbi:hypothetical protein KSP39_PZI023438 [Platanthera zijinensis]|uniref:Uncharacterized protein n=1 Tax=Platanthera zijinensis TaxID=2320716 RepID=A0AAP0AU03_9ASPA